MTTPNSIADQVTNTPAGPSGVHGLGDTFAADPHSGTGRFTVPIQLPAGRAGLSPSLALVYSSGGGAGVAGVGWSFGISSVRRRTDKGIPSYTDADTFVLGDDELVPVGNNRYRRRQEGSFARIFHIQEGNRDFWVVTTRNGTRHFYGRDATARNGDGKRISGWMLDKTQDRNGNEITYTYARDDAGKRTYLTQVDWGNGAWRAQITYEDRPDVLRNARTGMLQVTSQRVRSIDVQVKRSDTSTFFTFDSYTLQYSASPVTGLTRLESVLRTGTGEDSTQETWPLLTFGYTEPTHTAKATAVSGAPAQTLADPDLQLVDLDGNALPDLLVSDDYGYAVRRNDGAGGFEPPVRISGPNRALRESGVFLMDLDGKGFSDLVTPEGVYPNTGFGFGPFQAFGSRPNVDLESPTVRLTDADGDGLPDVLQIDDGFVRVYRSRASGGWSASTDRPIPEGRFPRLTEPGVRLVDFHGDGLSDLVRIHRGVLEVWPSLGNGQFGAMREVLIPETLPDGLTPSDIQLVDVTGTGAADLVVRQDDQVLVFANGTGEKLEDAVRIPVRAVSSRESMQTVDMFGTGVNGFLISADNGHWVFYALWNGEKPDVLASIDNGMGGQTTITYGSSVEHAQRDRRAGTPWRFPVPYSVRVVNEVRSVDTTTGFQVGTRFRYHEGYHDPEEREYRGFAIVEQLDSATLDSDALASANSRVVTYFALGNGWRFNDRYTPVPVPTPSDVLPSTRGARRALRGRPVRVETFGDDGTALANKPYTVSHTAFTVRTVVPPTDAHTGSFDAVAHVSEAYHLERTSDFRRMRTENVFDKYGRVTESRQIGYGRNGTFSTDHEQQQQDDLERVTRTTYLTRDEPEPTDYDAAYTPPWILDAPHEVSVYGVDGSTETLLSRSRTYYDGPDYEGLGYPGNATVLGVERGNVSARLVRCMSTTQLETDLPYAGAALAVTERGAYLELESAYWAHAERVTYDTAGQPVSALDPRGGESTVTYDEDHGLFPVSSVDAMGHPTTLTRGDLPYQVLSAVDANGNTTSMTYEPRNLLSTRTLQGKETSPGVWSGDLTTHPTEEVTYDLDVIPAHITVETRQVKQSDTLVVHRYLDGRGRTIQERHQAEDDPDTQATRWRVTGWQILDEKGNVIEAFQPVFGASSAYADGDTTVASITTDYDPLSRPVKVTHPDTTFESITYGPWTKEARDRNDNAGEVTLTSDPRYTGNTSLWSDHEDTPTTTFNDAFGRDIAVQEHNGEDAQSNPILHVTRSVLNLRDEVVEVWDARALTSATWTFTYDDAGNRWIAEHHTGAGARYSLTDAAGNPIWSRDARGVEIDRTFDALQRPLKEESVDLSTAGTVRIPAFPAGAYGHWSTYADSPGTITAGSPDRWAELTDQSGNGRDLEPPGTAPEVSNAEYLGPNGSDARIMAAMGSFSTTQMMRWGIEGGHGSIGDFMYTVRFPYDRVQSNNAYAFTLGRGGYSTGGSKIGTVQLRWKNSGTKYKMQWNKNGVGDIGPDFTATKNSPTNSKDSWIQYGIRRTVTGSDSEWRVVIIYDLDDGNGAQLVTDTTFTEDDTTATNSVVDNFTHIDMRGKGSRGSAQLWRGTYTDDDLDDALIAASMEGAGADITAELADLLGITVAIPQLRRQWTYKVYDDEHADHSSIQSKNQYGPPEEQRDADGIRIFEYDYRGLVTNTEFRFWDHAWQAGTDPMWVQGTNWDPAIPDTPRASVSSWMQLTHLTGNPTSVSITTTYDSAGRPVTVAYPEGFTVKSLYNAASALDELQLDRNDGNGFAAVAKKYEYDQRGKLLGWEHGNGVTTERTYDTELERLTRIFTRLPSGNLYQDLNYSYDPAGNPLEIRDDLTNPTYASNQVIPNTRSFEYDPRYRLTRAQGTKLKVVGNKTVNPYAPTPASTDYEAYDFAYAYDAVGNFTNNPEYGGSVFYKTGDIDLFAGDTTESAVSTNFTYDANGNTTHTPRHDELAYTFDSQPRFADMGGGGQVHWLRHGDQRCVRFADKGSVKTLTIYLGPWEYHRKTGTNARTKLELHISGPVKHAQAEKVLNGTDSSSLAIFYVHPDHLGSGQVLTKSDGSLLSQEEYLPYGRASDRRDERNRYRYIGVERDADVHLCMTGPRTYDPLSGRFLQADPVIQPGKGPWVYSSGNPTGRLDANGYSGDAFDATRAPQCTAAYKDGDEPGLEVIGWMAAVQGAAVGEMLHYAPLTRTAIQTAGQVEAARRDFAKEMVRHPVVGRFPLTMLYARAPSAKTVDGALQILGDAPLIGLGVALSRQGLAAAGRGTLNAAGRASGIHRFANELGEAGLRGIDDGVKAAYGWRPPLAHILDGHRKTQGFSAVFDAGNGRVLFAPSRDWNLLFDDPLPPGWVPRTQGHAEVSARLGGDQSLHHGFALIHRGNRRLGITWKSQTLNKTPDNLVPYAMRQRIEQAVAESTGWKVVPDTMFE